MKVTECNAYRNLLADVERDESKSPGFHDYRGKLKWILDRVEHYSEKTGASEVDILTSWENGRTYWYMNYYQDCNQPRIDSDYVRVFDTVDLFQESLGECPKFRCPRCSYESDNPYACSSQGCDWRSDGLFGTMGKGVFIFVKSILKGEKLFKPIAWE